MDNNDRVSLDGMKLRAVCYGKDCTQRTIAKKTGLGVVTVNRIFGGLRTSRKNAVAIAAALGVDVSELI